MMTKVIFRRENLIASLLFCIISWCFLYFWLYLMHAINEKADSTLLSSSHIRALISIAAFCFIIQKRPGILKKLIIITFGLILIFTHTIIIVHLLLNILPGIYDFIFYYACFLLIFFGGWPLYLGLRMIWIYTFSARRTDSGVSTQILHKISTRDWHHNVTLSLYLLWQLCYTTSFSPELK